MKRETVIKCYYLAKGEGIVIEEGEEEIVKDIKRSLEKYPQLYSYLERAKRVKVEEAKSIYKEIK